MQNLPFSRACENNKNAILEILNKVFLNAERVLEIGSGTGQHAIHFAKNLSHLHWQPSDRLENLSNLKQWVQAYPQTNLALPIELDVSDINWPRDFDAVFSANTAHIMPWKITQAMLKKVASMLPIKGLFTLYGPFNYHGKFTSESNRNFDRWLKDRAPHQGIRDFERINYVVCENGMSLLEDYEMPSNNRLLVWEKSKCVFPPHVSTHFP